MDSNPDLITGFIGYGSMGSMLVTSFLETGALRPDRVIISTRDKSRCEEVLERYPGLALAQDNRELVKKADRIILGVKPLDLLPVIQECSDLLDTRHHLISLAACVRIRDIEEIFRGRITRILPSITNRRRAGCILCCHNDQVTESEAGEICRLLERVGRVFPVREDQFEAAGDLMSCAPALIAAMIEEFALAGVRHSTLSQEQACDMAYATMAGTSLLLQDGVGVEAIIRRVATPGGITEEGVKVLRSELPPVFDHLFTRTLKKHTTVRRYIGKTKPARKDRPAME